MEFLLKFVGAVLVLNTVVLAGVWTYRTTTDPLLYRVLQVDDACGLTCWFGVQPDGSVIRRDIVEQVERSEAAIRVTNSRGSNINFAVEEAPGGTLAVQLIEGYGVSHCYFPRPTALTIGDVQAAFGEPDYLWVYVRSRFGASQFEYQMRFADERILVEGSFSPEGASQRTTPLIVVRSVCAATDRSIIRRELAPVEAPVWRGYEVDVEDYSADARLIELQ